MKKPLTGIVKEKLATGTKPVVALVAVIAKEERVTIQGVYKALRWLRAAGVVTVHNKQASLSLIWLEKEQQRLQQISRLYLNEQYLVESMGKGQFKSQFSFTTLRDLDHFWVHAYTILTSKLDEKECSYSIQPHDWYYYTELDSDAFWISKHQQQARIMRVVLTHASGLDYAVMRKRKSELGRLLEFTLDENPLKQKSYEYYNVIGPYVFKAGFDRAIVRQLDEFIATRSRLPLQPPDRRHLNSIVDREGKYTLQIEYSAKKADAMRRKVSKYFEF